MRSSPYIREVIKGFEGFEPTPRPDPGRGVLTVGYGHTKTAQKYAGQTITRETAERLFLQDVSDAENFVESFERKNGIRLTVPQFDALVSFVFNTGNIPQSIRDRITKLQGRPVANSIKLYNKSKNPNGQYIVLPGLTKRRTFEAARFNKTKKIFFISSLALLYLFVRNR